MSPGEILSIFGTAVGPNELLDLELDCTGKIATQFGPTRILFDGRPAPMVLAVSNQAGAIVPFSLDNGYAITIQAEMNGRLSNAEVLPAAPAKPGVFSIKRYAESFS